MRTVLNVQDEKLLIRRTCLFFSLAQLYSKIRIEEALPILYNHISCLKLSGFISRWLRSGKIFSSEYMRSLENFICGQGQNFLKREDKVNESWKPWNMSHAQGQENHLLLKTIKILTKCPQSRLFKSIKGWELLLLNNYYWYLTVTISATSFSFSLKGERHRLSLNFETQSDLL